MTDRISSASIIGAAEGRGDRPDAEIGRLVGRIWSAHHEGRAEPAGIDSAILVRVRAVIAELERS